MEDFLVFPGPTHGMKTTLLPLLLLMMTMMMMQLLLVVSLIQLTRLTRSAIQLALCWPISFG